jgi:beta-aspartyl-peptidase (threonine type)
MKKAAFLLLILFLFVQCKTIKTIPAENFAIVIHGGAGTILKKNMSPQVEAQYKAKLEEAVKAGYAILKNGGSSIDAVEKTINIMEDSPLFNAGRVLCSLIKEKMSWTHQSWMVKP